MNDIPNYIAVPISVFAGFMISWFITSWYHKKREKLYKIWKDNRELQLHLCYQTLGISYREFKKEFEGLLGKEKIYEQDYADYRARDYSKLRKLLEYNTELNNERYAKNKDVILLEEYQQTSMFSSKMFHFMASFEMDPNFDSDSVNRLKSDILHLEKECIEKYPNFLESGIIKSTFPIKRKSFHGGAPFK